MMTLILGLGLLFTISLLIWQIVKRSKAEGLLEATNKQLNKEVEDVKTRDTIEARNKAEIATSTDPDSDRRKRMSKQRDDLSKL